jgi:predicted DNA-binding antitoxin AbrB/MazE fold protein
MTHDVDAIYDQGVFRPLAPLVLPNGTRVHLRVEEESSAETSLSPPVRIRSPRLANPEQASEFVLEVREITKPLLPYHR